MEFIEYPDVQALKEVINLPFIYSKDKASLKAYLDIALKSNGMVKTRYSRRPYNGTLYGRYYVDNGAKVMTCQRQWRHIRTALFGKTETDIDIVNCHANILQNLCHLNHVKCTMLDSYVRDRENFINTQMNLTQDDVDRYNRKTCSSFTKKDLGKAIVCASVFGCSDYSSFYLTKSPYKKNFKAELSNIAKAITQLPVYEQLVNDVKITKPDSHPGSWLSFIIQEEELHYVSIAMKAFQEKGVEVTALIHDGFQIRCKDEQLIDSILHGVNTEIDVVRFIRKPFSTSVFELEIETESNEVEETDEIDGLYMDCQAFLNMTEVFEQTHAKILSKAKFITTQDDGTYIFKSQTDMLVSYQNMWFKDNDGKTRSFIKTWFNYPNMKTYKDIGVFPPGVRCPDGWFNTWTPFTVQTLASTGMDTQEQVDIILNHIKALCGHDEYVYKFVCAWIAFSLVYPSKKIACLVLISKQGAGKGTLMYLLERLFGNKRILSTSTPSRDVWGMFNGSMEHAYIVNLDELSKKETVDAVGQIKKLITDSTLTINRKGVGQYDVSSYHRFIVTTNNEDPIRSDADDRRNVIIRSSDEYCPCVMGVENSNAYFTKLRQAIDTDDVLVALYNHLIAIPDLDKFTSWVLPKTEQQKALQEMSRSDIDLWLEHHVSLSEGESEIELMATDAYASYKTWCDMNKKDYCYTNVQFGVRLRLLNCPGVTTGIKKRAGSAIKLDLIALRNHYGLIDELQV